MSMLATLRVMRQSLQTLALNATGQAASQIFALASSVGKVAALNAETSTGADATVNFTLASASGVLVLFSYTNIAASAAGNMIVSVDGADLVTVPLAITGGNAYPQTAFTFVGNLGPGLHSAAVRASTGLTGFSIAVVGSTR
jgi:hypothetical protein